MPFGITSGAGVIFGVTGGVAEAVIRREYPYLSPERVKALALGLSNPDAVPQLCLDDIAAYIRAALPSQEYE